MLAAQRKISPDSVHKFFLIVTLLDAFCLCVCELDNQKTCGRSLVKFFSEPPAYGTETDQLSLSTTQKISRKSDSQLRELSSSDPQTRKYGDPLGIEASQSVRVQRTCIRISN